MKLLVVEDEKDLNEIIAKELIVRTCIHRRFKREKA